MERETTELSDHVVIAGYGVPGRAVAEMLEGRGLEFCVIEMNKETVDRCRHLHCFFHGDCADPAVLRAAGIERARLFVVAIPNEDAALAATKLGRQMNPTMRIVTRCRYTSGGFEAKANGADDVIVAEQVVASRCVEAVTMYETTRV
ncbi:MAG: NAD-binding protein [Phycisphaerae bacterium]